MTPPGSAFWGPQSRRRLAVASLYLGCLAGLLFCACTTRGAIPYSLGSVLMIVSALGGLFGLVGVVQTRRTLFFPAAGLLDERQRSVQDRAYKFAYQGLGAAVVIVALLLGLAHFGRFTPPHLTRGEVGLLLGVLFLVVLTLPSAMMAWTEPDPPEDSGAFGMVNRRSL